MTKEPINKPTKKPVNEEIKIAWAKEKRLPSTPPTEHLCSGQPYTPFSPGTQAVSGTTRPMLLVCWLA